MTPLALHPEYPRILARLQDLVPQGAAFHRRVYRMIIPRHCGPADILNGAGGLRADGRWNPKGRFRCAYASESPETALAEVLIAFRRKGLPDEKALPRVLVCLAIDAKKTLDLTLGRVRQSCRLSLKRMIGERWWIENQAGREAWTQAVGRAAAEVGFEAIIAPSAADPETGVNVIVFPENLGAASRWVVITPVPGKK